MMGNIQYWQLATDGLLVVALLFLAIRFTRSSSGYLQSRSADLQSGLRALIKEADKAGQILNDTLASRQKELKRLLTELQESEIKSGQFESEVTAVKQELDGKLDAAKGVIQTLDDALEALESHAQSFTEVTPSSSVSSEAVAKESARSVTSNEAAQLSTAPTPLTAAMETTTYDPSPEPPSFTKADKAKVNIYGEPINRAAAKAAYQKPVTLHESIERESGSSSHEAIGVVEQASVSQVYEAAEKLLRAGHDLQAVAARTRLPVDEIRMLARVVAEESQSVKSQATNTPNAITSNPYQDEERKSPVLSADNVLTSREDSRLGVLGTMKRDRYTV